MNCCAVRVERWREKVQFGRFGEEKNWCVPGDFRDEFIFRLYLMGICTTKNQGTIENKSIKKYQIIKKIPDASRCNQEC